MEVAYYKAYDDRYRQVHGLDLQWFADAPTPIVGQIAEEFALTAEHRMLEIGCGEGRDAVAMLRRGFDLAATDVSPEAVAYCQARFSEFADRFQVLDCLTERADGSFDFIFAVAVLHMLVEDVHRDAFYRFFVAHLKTWGIGLICTMGDGTSEFSSDVRTAFDLQPRRHDASGQTIHIAGTSCRVVRFSTFEAELHRNGLDVVRMGMTSAEPDFPQLMYAVVRVGGAER